jgi:hypothetical protein
MNLQKIDTDIEVMQERVWDEYNMTYAGAVEHKQADFNMQEGLVEAGKLKKQISALGYVNVAAIEEIKDVTARYDDMTSQRDDLLGAEADLLKIIKELTNEMETKFKTQFDQINTNFQKTFRELFGGGRHCSTAVDVVQAHSDVVLFEENTLLARCINTGTCYSENIPIVSHITLSLTKCLFDTFVQRKTAHRLFCVVNHILFKLFCIGFAKSVIAHKCLCEFV